MAHRKSTSAGSSASTFPIPASLHDLERDPYNLLPYPYDFDDEDEAARADSFTALVDGLEDGNHVLSTGGISLFENLDDDDQEIWMGEERVQALYTLVRKSTSLAPGTRAALVNAVCEALQTLSSILSSTNAGQQAGDSQVDSQGGSHVVPQGFRDAFACHLYMLFSIMFFIESEAKVGNSLKMGEKGEKSTESKAMAGIRNSCAKTMMIAAQAMAKNRTTLWVRGVPDESVVILPCRIAFQMLESATGVVARKTSSADEALAMIAASVDSTEGLISTVVAGLMDLMHSYEHMAPLCSELCCMVSENPTNKLAVELLREIGRLNTYGLSGGDAGGKASGIRNVAPFVSQLASLRPRLVLSNIAFLTPHLSSDFHNLRSHIITAVANILSSPEGLGLKGSDQDEGSPHTEMPSDAKSRATLLEILRERVHDVSSFTRSAALKAWIQVVQKNCLPVEWFIQVTEVAIDRLRDKTVLTRRIAMQLLTAILENNPFMGDLNPTRYRAKLEELTKFVVDNLPEDLRLAQASMVENGEDQSDANLAELQRATIAAAVAEAEAMKEEDGLTEQQEIFRSKVKALQFTQACLSFVQLFEDSSDIFQGMLLSSNSSDTTEALRFFVQARLFKLPCAVSGMKNALTLMWSTEQAIREEVRKAFIEVFLAEPGTDGKEHLPHDQIAENLLVLVGEATISELASIEEAIISLVQDEKVPANVFLILWSIVSKGSRDAKASAMLLISMAAGAGEKGRVLIDSKSRLKVLLDSCLGDHAEEHKDWRLTRAASSALQKVDRAVVDEGCAKYLVLERLLEQLAVVCRGDWCVDERHQDTLEWFSASEEAIKAVFKISPSPEESSAEIVRGMYRQTFKNGSDTACHSLRLARFFHVLGNVALNLLCYTEALSSGVRHASAKKTLQKQVEADGRKAKKASASKDSDSEDEIEAELGIAAAVEAETERQMAEITETEILGSGLNAAFVPLLVKVVGNEGGNFSSSVILMQAAMLALCKFMCVSASFCQKHLPLVFSALARAPEGDTTMRANTVVALSDLAFRFPNEMEPYTPFMFQCLRDSSTYVRRSTLMALTHLILNDMVKVKGQVCEIALCLQDDDCRIRDMAGLLFQSLGARSNSPIYNLLPDTISHLSQRGISQEQFRSIMLFLLGFIKKERQSLMLTEKLALRMGKTTELSQKADLAYCISQLKHSEKSIKILIDNFKLYKDALYDEDVKKSFLSVLSKAKKGAKNEQRERLDEFEQQINECSDRGKEDDAAEKNARKTRKGRKKKVQVPVDESDDDEFEAGEPEVNKENTNRRSNRRRAQNV